MRAGLPAADARADRLRGVFDDRHAGPGGDRQDRVHVGAEAVQVRPGRIALVRGVIARAMASGSTLNVTGSISTNTGVAPRRLTHPAVAKNENVGVMTSSPGPMPERHQHGQQGVGARRHGDGVLRRRARGELALERVHLRARG